MVPRTCTTSAHTPFARRKKSGGEGGCGRLLTVWRTPSWTFWPHFQKVKRAGHHKNSDSEMWWWQSRRNRWKFEEIRNRSIFTCIGDALAIRLISSLFFFLQRILPHQDMAPKKTERCEVTQRCCNSTWKLCPFFFSGKLHRLEVKWIVGQVYHWIILVSFFFFFF